MSITTIDPPSLFCLNSECENHLTSWEIRRMHPVRISKWWFCGKCRHIAHRQPIYVKCFECNTKFIHLNNQKYCDECATHARGRDISWPGVLNGKKEPFIISNLMNFTRTWPCAIGLFQENEPKQMHKNIIENAKCALKLFALMII